MEGGESSEMWWGEEEGGWRTKLLFVLICKFSQMTQKTVTSSSRPSCPGRS